MNTESNMYTVDKYSDLGNFEAERQAVEKFEALKANSTNSLKASRRYIAIAYVIILCLTLILGIFAFSTSHRSTNDFIDMYEGPLAIRYTTQSMDISALNVYVAMRDLALSEPGQVERIEKCISDVEKNLIGLRQSYESLYDLTSGNPDFLKALNELGALLDTWSVMRNESIEFAREGNMEACRHNVVYEAGPVVEKINQYSQKIINTAAEFASTSYLNNLAFQRQIDFYTITITAFLMICGIVILSYIWRHTANAVKMVERSQMDQNEILDELIVMDETLRQNLSKLENEGEIIREIQEKYSNSLEAANDVIMEANIETGEFFVSEKWEEITGSSKMDKFDVGEILEAIFPEDRYKFEDGFSKKNGRFNMQFRIVDDSGDLRWLEVRGKWLDDHRFSGSISDITSKKQSEQYIEYMAYHDSITHLPNRAMFIRRLEEALVKARTEDVSGCVLFIDLDNFKLINDSHGHDFGDKLLLAVSRKLRQALGENTLLARFGGDEFLVLVENIYEQNDILKYIQKITDSLSTSVLVDGNPFFVTASIGVSVFPHDGDDVSQLLKNSDAAMYESKYAGRNTYAFYTSAMSDKVLRKAAITNILRNAINDDLIYMVYQPQYHSNTNKVISCEALMRLRVDEDLGFIAPDEFIPVAEETRLIIPLGYWAIRKVIETDMALQKQGIEFESISVNVSEMQLSESDFVESLKNIIDEYGYDAKRLHIEVTESILLNNLDEKIEIFEALRGIGVRIELDDFGTGYSSLNYVRMIPLDALKIDKCFIDEIGISEEKEELIGLMISLARMFGASVVAEGVENDQQLDFLREKGDIIIQGYYYSKPVEARDLPVRIDELNKIVSQGK